MLQVSVSCCFLKRRRKTGGEQLIIALEPHRWIGERSLQVMSEPSQFLSFVLGVTSICER
jgi:hypothetical protein